MELVNIMQAIGEPDSEGAGCRTMRFALETTVLLLSPIVPHFCEELWASLGYDQSVLLMPMADLRRGCHGERQSGSGRSG